MCIRFDRDNFTIYFIKSGKAGNNEIIVNHNEKFYGSVAKQSHVIFDYRDTFKNAHDELVKEVAEFVKTGKISGFAELFKAHVKHVKIKSLTTDKIKEIHAANLMLFSKLAEEVNEYLLLEEINKI